jgi:hypothetical protein
MSVYTGVTQIENSTESHIIRYVNFRYINFLCFLPYSFSVPHANEWYVEAEV